MSDTRAALTLLLVAIGPAAGCSPSVATFVDELCNRDTDCAGYMRCDAGKCVEVPDAECAIGDQCLTPAPCEAVIGARCVAGRCLYPARACDAEHANTCEEADGVFVSYPTIGVCDAETDACIYEPTRTPCPNCTATCLASCAGYRCDDLAGGCRQNGTCVPGTPATCQYEAVADGSACALPDDQAPELSGFCASGACQTCVADQDCPGVAAACTDTTATTTCQGKTGVGRCRASLCTIDWVDDDSVCVGNTHTCPNNLAAIACTAAADQPVAACPSRCGGNGDCVDGFACANGSCTCRINDPCNDLDPCTYDDRCNSAGRCAGQAVTAHSGCQSDGGTCGTARACNGTATCTESTPGTSTGCNDGDDCTSSDHCNGAGSCVGDACGGGNVCYPTYGCLATPTFSIPAAGLCANSGVAHAGTSSDYLFKYVVTGPPGAHVIKYNRHDSCSQTSFAPAPETPVNPGAADAKFIGADGTYTFLLGNAVVTNCEGGGYGGYTSYATVDGISTGTASSTYYNSRCYSSPANRNFKTCSAAQSYCSPCNAGAGCETQGQYCDVYSGGAPTCRFPAITTDPYCANGGLANGGGAYLIQYTVVGPQGARVHKLNRHASCGATSWTEGSETSGAVVRIDGAGRYQLMIQTSGPLDCASFASMMGLWTQFATVGDDAEEFPLYTTAGTIDNVYYDSACGGWGFDSCSLALSYCGE